MKRRQVIDVSKTPDGEPLELVQERGHFVIRIAGEALMSSDLFGSEQRMAQLAAEMLNGKKQARVLIGGLGMGFTLRAALDAFGSDARITVAELLPAVVRFNRGVLKDLAGRPLMDRRVRLFQGDVRVCLAKRGWDAVLMDIDNGPDAFTVESNDELYGDVTLLAQSLSPGGVLIVWSAFSSVAFERRLRGAGLSVETKRVYARADQRKGGKHVLFVARASNKRRATQKMARPSKPRGTQGRQPRA